MEVKIRHKQVVQQHPAVGVRIHAHAPIALRRQVGQFRDQPASVVEQLLGPVAFHPALKLCDMIRMGRIHDQRHLMGPEGALDLEAINDFRSGPTLGRSQNNHRPTWPGGVVAIAGVLLDPVDVGNCLVQRRGH